MPPSEVRRRFTARDLLEVGAYYKLKAKYDGNPPPLFEDDAMLLRAGRVIESGAKPSWATPPDPKLARVLAERAKKRMAEERARNVKSKPEKLPNLRRGNRGAKH